MREAEASMGRIDVLANVAGVMVNERIDVMTEEGIGPPDRDQPAGGDA